MKTTLIELLKKAIFDAGFNQQVEAKILNNIQIDRARDEKHGDFASNLALILAKPLDKKPREVAETLVKHLPKHDAVTKIEIAGPGFINFYIAPQAKLAILQKILQEKEKFGQSDLGKGASVLIEFVSSNPTGPLHVGHGRGAAFGSALSNLLKFTGFKVHREYYVNDAGRQMDILTASIWLRYLELFNQTFEFPSNGYQGEYIKDIASQLRQVHKDEFMVLTEELFTDDLPKDEAYGGDKETYIDAIIKKAKSLIGFDAYRTIFAIGLNMILSGIKDDLSKFRVEFDEWFSEQSLFDNGLIEDAIGRLKRKELTYEKEGALWFKATQFNDEKDRVLVRANGQSTYFASDVAYHMNKFDRGFTDVVDILGADHHGYVPRIKAVLQALDYDAEKFTVPLVQFAVLYRGDEKVPMSTRSGQYVTLQELCEEVGTDAARFFYVQRRAEQHMDFDLELAKSKSNENPVYYIQYAHARIHSVFKQLHDRNLSHQEAGVDELTRLDNSHEKDLLDKLDRFPELIEVAAKNKEPHQLAHYLLELACDFHTYYNAHQFIVDDGSLRKARLTLIDAVRIVIQNGLELLGITAPEAM